jgi:cell division protein FtsQ
MGLPQRLMLDAATWAASAGLSVRQVEISGDARQPRLDIYREVLSGGSDSMFLVDLQDLRARLMDLPWVADASIRRQWPDTLSIQLVERAPIAIWQVNGRYALVDAGGEPLPPAPLADYADLPLVVGPGAGPAAGALLALLADHARIADALVGAVRVGERRWDLKLESGETISLPEDAQAPAALARFAQAERQAPVLGQGFLRIDLRIPGKMAIRLSPEALERERQRQQAEARRRREEAARALPPAPAGALPPAPTGALPAAPAVRPPQVPSPDAQVRT